jgi:hypothetical protein
MVVATSADSALVSASDPKTNRRSLQQHGAVPRNDK